MKLQIMKLCQVHKRAMMTEDGVSELWTYSVELLQWCVLTLVPLVKRYKDRLTTQISQKN